MLVCALLVLGATVLGKIHDLGGHPLQLVIHSCHFGHNLPFSVFNVQQNHTELGLHVVARFSCIDLKGGVCGRSDLWGSVGGVLGGGSRRGLRCSWAHGRFLMAVYLIGDAGARRVPSWEPR